MAMQAGIGLSRIFLIAGAGYTGTIFLKNGKLSDVLGELQNLVKGMEKSGESEGDSDYSDAIATQIRRLAMEVRQLASSRQITVLNGSSTQGKLTSLVIPAAAIGTVGYGYMRWKGYSFSDLMFVTQKNIENAVSNLTEQLKHMGDYLAAAKKHLTQRIENLDGKVDEQIEISKLIRNEVNEAQADLSQMGFDLNALTRVVTGLDSKVNSLGEKQEFAAAGVMYLCSLVDSQKMPMPKGIQDQFKLAGNSMQNLMGLRAIVEPPEYNLLTDGTVQDYSSDKLNKTITRTFSYKC